MMSNVIVAAAPVVQMHANKGSAFGNVGAAFFAFVFLVVSWILAKHNKGPWGPWFGKKLENVKWDWKSLMSAVFGFLGVTAALGSTGMVQDFSQWIQSLFEWLGAVEIVNTIGMAGVCVLIGLKVWLKRDDNIHDIVWGGVAALAFPLGGGMWTATSLAAGNLLVNLMNGIPNA
jgi:hypothetical protein